MIDIQLYRARIGLQIFMMFPRNKAKEKQDVHSKGGIKTIMVATLLNISMYDHFEQKSFKVELLKIAGDIQLNPGLRISLAYVK